MVKIRGDADDVIHQIAKVLAGYQKRHKRADVEIYRYNRASVRIRIIDPDFKGISRNDRHDLIWDMFEHLPEEVQWEISILLLFAPEETKNSFANMEFDHPVASTL